VAHDAAEARHLAQPALEPRTSAVEPMRPGRASKGPVLGVAEDRDGIAAVRVDERQRRCREPRHPSTAMSCLRFDDERGRRAAVHLDAMRARDDVRRVMTIPRSCDPARAFDAEAARGRVMRTTLWPSAHDGGG